MALVAESSLFCNKILSCAGRLLRVSETLRESQFLANQIKSLPSEFIFGIYVPFFLAASVPLWPVLRLVLALPALGDYKLTFFMLALLMNAVQ